MPSDPNDWNKTWVDDLLACIFGPLFAMLIYGVIMGSLFG